MSKYTTEVRFICETASGLSESKGLASVDTIVETACPKIFDDDIPFFDEDYRLPLEKKILMHYYTREISGETVGVWKLWLNNRMREIMPYYNQLYKSSLLKFNPLYTKNLTETFEGEGSKIGDDSGTTTTHGDSTNDATSRRLYSDTPQGALTGVENETYLTNATKNIGHDGNVTNGSVISDNHSNHVSTDNYVKTVAGYEGSNASKLLLDFRKTLINIDVMVIEELGDLFFNLW